MPFFVLGGLALGAAATAYGADQQRSGMEDTNAANAAQAQANRDWQWASMMETQNYNTTMSNTAEQRRMDDLKAAGLNPQLAVGNPASSPMSSSGPGAQATMQNPKGGYGAAGAAIGSEISGAAQQVATVRNINADTALKQAQTPGDVIPVDPDTGKLDWSRANGGMLGNMNVQAMSQQVDQGKKAMEVMSADIRNKDSQTKINDAVEQLQGLNVQILRALKESAIAQGKAEAGIASSEAVGAENMRKILGSPAGIWIQAAEMLLGKGPVNSGVSIFNRLQYPTQGR